MSLINQTYPKDKYEIIIADGKSEDGTLDVIRKFQDKYIKEGLVITVVTNEKKILATGWNIAINAAKGEYVTRIDAHAEAEPDFVENSIKAILKVDAVCVGGKLTSLSLDGAENVISKVLSSPFGVGNSSFRVSSQACYADTAVYGLYKKSVFEEVGYFNEKMVRNQDIELHSRIKAAGYKFYFDPSIKSTYYTRTTLSKMLKQAYGNGFWNMILLKERKFCTFVTSFNSVCICGFLDAIHYLGVLLEDNMGFMFGYCLSSFMFGAIFRWQENALFVRDFRNVLAIYVPTSGIWLGVYNGYIQGDSVSNIL